MNYLNQKSCCKFSSQPNALIQNCLSICAHTTCVLHPQWTLNGENVRYVEMSLMGHILQASLNSYQLPKLNMAYLDPVKMVKW